MEIKEEAIAEKLLQELKTKTAKNIPKYNYYLEKLAIKDLGVSIPTRILGLNVVLGWAQQAVDSLLERIYFRGFWNPISDDEALNNIVDFGNNLFDLNYFEIEQKNVIKDSLITGCSYISVGAGNEENGEPPVIWRAENPNFIFGDYNHRNHKLNSALKMVSKDNFQLFTDSSIIDLQRINGKLVETNRIDHNLNLVPVISLANNPSSIKPRGVSEITPALRGYIDSGMRVLLAGIVVLNFYSLPFRFLTGADPDDLLDSEGRPINFSALKAGNILNLPKNRVDDIIPRIEQLTPSSPTEVMSMLNPLIQLVSNEIGVPASDLGLQTTNPTSADAMIEANKKQIAKANNRIPVFKKAFEEMLEISLKITNQPIPDNFHKISATFMRPETPTPAAAADRMSKLVAAGIFQQEYPSFIYRELGLSETEIQELKIWQQNSAGQNLIQQLIAGNTPPANTSES